MEMEMKWLFIVPLAMLCTYFIFSVPIHAAMADIRAWFRR
jgi:hypothetical protein